MKKTFASNLQISLRILKETFDDQYDDCLSQLGTNEIQIKLESKLTDISKLQVFKKREKLVYSPEAGQKGTQEELELPDEKILPTRDNFKLKLDNLLEQTQNQVYQFDKIINYTKSTREAYQDLIEIDINDTVNKNKQLLLINILKSDTILNYSSEPVVFKEECLNLKEEASIDKTGFLPVIIRKFLECIQQKEEIEKDIFENQAEANDLRISAFTISSNKLYDISVSEGRICDTEKDISKIKISSIEDALDILSSIRSNVLNKKMSIAWVGYRIKANFWDGKAMKSAKVHILDFINPFDKIPERIEKDQKKIECNPDFLSIPMKILLWTFTREQSDYNIRDKFFTTLSKCWNYNSKVHFLGNVRSIAPYYHQNFQVILLLSKILTQREKFDTFFNELLFKQLKEKEQLVNHLKRIHLEETDIYKPYTKTGEIRSQEIIQKTRLEKEALDGENQQLKKVVKTMESKLLERENEINYLKTQARLHLEKVKASHDSEKQKLLNLIENLSNESKNLPTIEKEQAELLAERDNLLKKNDKLESNLKKCLEELNQLRYHFSNDIKHNISIENNIQRSDNLSEQRMQALSEVIQNFLIYSSSEINKTLKVSQLLKGTYEKKITLMKKKCYLLKDRNKTMEEVITLLLTKIDTLDKERMNLFNENNRITAETKVKFQELKNKMMEKLNSKNQEIIQYESYFGDLDKRLKQIEGLQQNK